MTRPSEPDLATAAEVGLLVIEEALNRFEACGAAEDFCVQSVGAAVVFGGTNRILWTASAGFRPDVTYCTPRFLAAYRENYST